MKSFYKTKNGKLAPTEIYKLQTSLFGPPAVLIYNCDKSETHEETNPKNVEKLKEFMGKDVVKCYAEGYYFKDKIWLIHKLEDEELPLFELF